MLSSTRTITTDLRHIDPNPDRIQINNVNNSNNLTNQSNNKTKSLLLLSTSAEAAVAESKKFERSRSRNSSLCTSRSTPPNQTTITQQRNNNHHHHITPKKQNRISNLIRSSLSSSQSSCRSSESPPPPPPPPLENQSLLSHSPFHHQFHAKLPNNHSILNFNNRPHSDQNHLFKCEKCLKVYRHPQCLVKHRWEHTEYWADASKLMLSKHQQVQMLEAAAILAAPSGSLPESRSLWPAAVSSSEAGLLGSDRVNLQVICSQQADSKNMNHRSHRHSSASSCGILPTSRALTDVEMCEETESKRSIEEDVDDKLQQHEGDGDDDDEIMFEMTLEGDENSSPKGIPNSTNSLTNRSRLSFSSRLSTSSASAPPPIGYFERRNPESVSSVISDFEKNHNKASSSSASSINSMRSKNRNLVTCLPATVAYQPPRLNNNLNQQDHINLHHHHHQTIGFAYHSSESLFKPIAPYQDSQLRFETSSNQDLNQNPLKNNSDFVDGHHHHHHSLVNSLDVDTEDDDDDDAWTRSVDPEREREGDEVVGMEL